LPITQTAGNELRAVGSTFSGRTESSFICEISFPINLRQDWHYLSIINCDAVMKPAIINREDCSEEQRDEK
jgi:hypothetical protein